MRFIIYGAGAVGGVIGTRLFQNGYEVILIARGAHLETIQQKGLLFESPTESTTIPIDAVGHPSEIEFQPGDVVFMTMKSQHCLSALRALRDAAGENIPVICCQNGVDNERMALRLFNRVYAMMVYLPANHMEPGVIQTYTKTINGILDTGVYPQGIDSTVEQITTALDASNFSSKPDPQVMRWKYSKLLINLVNAFQVACPIGSDFQEIRKILRAEGHACYKAAGIYFATEEEESERRGTLLQYDEIKGKQRLGSSSLQSIMKESGDIEADYLNGEIVLLGRLHGIPTPANRVLQRVSNQIAHEKGQAGRYSVDEIKIMIQKEAQRSPAK